LLLSILLTLFGVFDGGHSLGAKVSMTSLVQWMKYVGRNYTKSVLPILMIGLVLREES